MRTDSIPSLLAVVLVQVLAALAVVFMHSIESRMRRVLPYVVSAAVGVLLGTALIHLLPDAVAALGERRLVGELVAATMAALYALGKIVHLISGYRAEPVEEITLAAEPCSGQHGHEHHHHGARPASLLTGSVLHSVVDGCAIAVAFVVSRRTGWITAAAVALHEVPHRMGDFAVLLHLGVRRGRALLLAIAAGAAGTVGWCIVVGGSNGSSQRVAWLLPVSAGSFLYIALADLLPELLRERRPRTAAVQALFLAAGVALAAALAHLPGA